MCFDGVARVSRAAAQLAFFVAVGLDVCQGKAIWNGYIDSLFLNALPVPMLATGFLFLSLFSLRFSMFFLPQGGLKMDPQHGPRLGLVLGGVLERYWEGFFGGQDAPKKPQGDAKTAMMTSFLGSIF